MAKIIELMQKKFYVELIIATIIFIIASITNKLVDAIIYMLYFIIILEVVRTIIDYIREHRINLPMLIDAFIILALRELIVNVVKINNENIDSIEKLFASSLNYNILIISGVIVFLIFVRYLSVKTSHKYIMDKMKKDDCNCDD